MRLSRERLLVPEVVRALAALPPVAGGYDPWGFSPEQARLSCSLAYHLCRYFRPQVQGLEHIPPGRVLLVANHSGQLPFDGLVLMVQCLVGTHPPRLVRAMIERWVLHLPFFNLVFRRAGAVLGDPVNCKNLLEQEQAVLVFPEGARGSGKVWGQRYRLVPFGHGFMRLALQTGTPIVPVAVVGAEESIISLYNAAPLARLLRMPYLPLPPLLPLLGLAAYLPLPARFYLELGPPLRFTGSGDEEEEEIAAKVELVRSSIEQMIRRLLARRPSVFA